MERLLVCLLLVGVVGCGTDVSKEERREYVEWYIKDISKKIEKDPDFGGWYEFRGEAYCELGDYRKGIADYTEAIRITPDGAQAYYSRSLAYRELGNDVKADADFAKFKELGFPEPGHSAEESQQEETVDPTPQKESVPMEDGAEIDPRYLKYAVAKIRDYDLNKDGVLTNEEWSKSPGFIKDEMDADKDGKLTPTEYARALIRR